MWQVEIVLAFAEIETPIFKLGQDRLELDDERGVMQTGYDAEREARRPRIIKMFGVQPPSVP